MDQQLPATKTPIDPTSLYQCLRAQWHALVGTDPSRASLLVLLTHWDYETASGASCICFNLGNAKWTAGCGTDFCCFATTEYVNGQKVTIAAGQPGSQFRAFTTLDAGAADYLRLLRGQFGFCWPSVEAGDVAAFAHALKVRNYYTAPEAQYAAGLAARLAKLNVEIGEDTKPDAPIPIARVQPTPGDDNSDQPTPPGSLPEPDDAA